MKKGERRIMTDKVPPSEAARRVRDVQSGDESAAKPGAPEELVPANEIAELRTVAELRSLEFIPELRPDMIDRVAALKIPEDLARRYDIIAISHDKERNFITIATHDPDDLNLTDSLPLQVGCDGSTLVVASADDIMSCINSIYANSADRGSIITLINGKAPPLDGHTKDITIGDEDNPSDPETVRLFQAVMGIIFSLRASDVSIEPNFEDVIVRARVDSRWRDIDPPYSLAWHRGLISYIKSMAGMDITENRKDLDGSIHVVYRQKRYDIRIACLATVSGESITLRVLDSRNVQRTLTEIGLSDYNVAILNQQVMSPNGVILVTGPTGSGKTTTLYAVINTINSRETKILTIEDPVEYRVPGIVQIQVNEKGGLSFPAALRASLRQAPNVILIGEMRDAETATIAMRAALTGHLVLSTLHTTNAIKTVSRLIDMGVPPFMIADSVRTIIAQRLIRRLCRCASIDVIPDDLIEILQLTSSDLSRVRQPKGCPECFEGYRGQTGIHEILVCDDEVGTIIAAGNASTALPEYVKTKMRTLRQDGCLKALTGVTSLQEVLRMTNA